MFVEHKVFIGLRDVALDNKVTNTAFLSYLEDAGGVHSNIAGFGLHDIPTVKRSWVLISWKVQILNRPKYGDTITIKTWSRGLTRLYAYRDYYIYDENNNKIAIATSKWVFVDTELGKITKITENIGTSYTVENEYAFDNKDIEKLNEPKSYIDYTTFTVNRSLIDINNHLHNIYYLDIANEVLPLDIYKNTEFNNIEVMCKKEIKLGDTVKVFYNVENDVHTITIKSEDESVLHAIIKYK